MLRSNHVPGLWRQCAPSSFPKFSKALFRWKWLYVAFLFCAIVTPLEAKQERRCPAGCWHPAGIGAGIGSNCYLDTKLSPMPRSFRKDIIIFNPTVHKYSILFLYARHQVSNRYSFGRIAELSFRGDGHHKNLRFFRVPLLWKIKGIGQPAETALAVSIDVTNDMPSGSRSRVLPARNYHPSDDVPSRVQYRGYLQRVLEYESTLCTYERTFCNGGSSFGFHPQQNSGRCENCRKSSYRVLEQSDQEPPDPGPEDLHNALVLIAAGTVGSIAGVPYLLKPNRTGKRWILVLVRIGVTASVLAVNLTIVGLREVFGD